MNQLKVGVALNYIVILLNIAVGLLYTPYMLRMMGQSEYGLYSLVASVIAYLTVLDLGFGNAIVRYTAKFRAEGRTKEQYEMFGMFLVLYCAIGVLTFLVGAALYFNIDNMFGDTMTAVELDRTRIMILILIFNLAFTFPMSIFGSIMTAYERFVFPKLINIIRTLLNVAVMIVLLKMGYRAIAMVVVHTIFNITTLLINYVYCKRKLKIKIYFIKFRWDFLREVTIYSFWIFLNAIMDRIYWSTGQFVLGMTSGTVAVSVFAIAIQLESIYMMFSTAIASVFLPKVTGIVTRNDDTNVISNLFIRTGRIQNIMMSMILLGFIVFGKQFIVLWAGAEYESAYYVALLFFVALYIPLIQNLGITILQARNQMKFRCLLYIAIALVSLVAEVVLAKAWGGIGCAAAIAGALLLGQGLIMNIYYNVKQKLNILKFWKEIIRMNIAPVVVSVCSILLLNNFSLENTWSTLMLCMVVYAIVYALVCYFFSMNKYERNELVMPIIKKFIR